MNRDAARGVRRQLFVGSRLAAILSGAGPGAEWGFALGDGTGLTVCSFHPQFSCPWDGSGFFGLLEGDCVHAIP